MVPTPLFGNSGLPDYHEGMLIVKTRSTGATPAFFTANALAPAPLVAPGLATLALLERAGRIKRVVPLSTPADGGGGAAPAMIAAAGSATGRMTAALFTTPAGDDPNDGVSIVELERDADVDSLQTALANDPNIEFVSRVPVRYLLTDAAADAADADAVPLIPQNAPPAADSLWNLKKIQWSQARDRAGFQDASTVRVAVLDTGVQQDHPDLAGRVFEYTFTYPGFGGNVSANDLIGHGTHVSGTIAASINNNLGINGICTCQLYVLKIFDDTPDYLPSRNTFAYFVDPVMYRQALGACLTKGIQVINLSIGGGGKPDHQEQILFDALLASGTVIVAAMGNDRQIGSPTSYPAAIPGVIAVGATDLNDSVASFSNGGNHIALCAPGVAIWSTLPTYPGQFGFDAVPGPGGFQPGKPQSRETDYAAWNGTSMATPHVTASVALLLAKNPALKPDQVRQALALSADPVPGMNGAPFHPDYGAGRLNLARLLQ